MVVVPSVVVIEDVLVVDAVLAASKSFSIEIGVVDGVGQPVNSVVALLMKQNRNYIKTNTNRETISSPGRP